MSDEPRIGIVGTRGLWRRIFLQPSLALGHQGELTFRQVEVLGFYFWIFFFSGPEPNSAESNMKSVSVWMCVHAFLLLIGEM